MLPFGVTIPATVPQSSEIPEGLMNYFVYSHEVAQLVEALRYKPEGCGFYPRWCHFNFSLTLPFRPQCGPGVDSVFNRNEYQKYFLGVKAADAYG